SYDLWQFQNTPYYGSSVVRMSGLFTLVYFSLPLLKKIEWPKIVWVGVTALVLMSYSTCLLPVFGLFAIGILAVKLLLISVDCLQKKAWLKAAAALLGAAAIILFALLANRVLVLPASDLYETYRNSVESFQATNFVKDAMLRYGWVIIAVSLLLSRSRVQAGLSLLALFMWWSAAGFRLYNLIGLLSAGFDFVAFRFEGTVQMMLFFLMAVCLIKLVDWLKCSFWVAGGCSAAALAAALLIFFANMGQIIEHNYLGSGVSDYGWDFSRIFNFNSDMSADTARMIGDYINTLPYGTYRILSDNPVPNDSEYFLPNQFLMTSNRTQIVSLPYPYNWDLDTGGTVLEYVSTGEPDGQSALEWMDREGVDYAVVTSEKAKDELTAAGREVVLETRPKPEVPLYLIKIK
ncbi:MAG: hypothetical protein HUJ54_07095, partial [Erysipelotrichaceae bacterium]|nr:hypothetical protein [Erysipelotrichaceae bacterium]